MHFLACVRETEFIIAENSSHVLSAAFEQVNAGQRAGKHSEGHTMLITIFEKEPCRHEEERKMNNHDFLI
jgi:pyrimidine deaminase RibD-like protein